MAKTKSKTLEQTMSEKNLILLSLKDFFTKQMLKYSLAPFIVTLVLMYILFFVVAGLRKISQQKKNFK